MITLDGNVSVYIARFDSVEKSEEKMHQEKGHIFPHENGTKKVLVPWPEYLWTDQMAHVLHDRASRELSIKE